MMKRTLLLIAAALLGLSLLTACSDDEPNKGEPIQVKPEAERNIWILTQEGEIYDQTGAKVKTLPDCYYASQIIPFGTDYYVAGRNEDLEKNGFGYWKNGEWVTVLDWVQPAPVIASWRICKRYDDIYLLTNRWESSGKYGLYIYKNGNPVRQDDFNRQDDVNRRHGQCTDMTVSGNNTYLTGYEYDDDELRSTPLLWTNGQKKSLPIGNAYGGMTSCVYASGSTRNIVGGCVMNVNNGLGKPALWIDHQLTILKTSSDTHWGQVYDVLESNGHIYALGYENEKATLWIDNKPEVYHHNSFENETSSSYGVQMQLYGSDLYVLTNESYTDVYYHIWMNGQHKNSVRVPGNVVGFAVF